MSNKSQRRKERHTRKRKEKREKQEKNRSQNASFFNQEMPVLGGNERHQQRLSQQHPQAWPGEIAEDVAVFDDSVLSTLSPEFSQQVLLIRESIRMATESRGEEALKSLSAIPRTSPLSEWRLFLRGLVEWLASQPEKAEEAWKRLDSERRPGRIAMAMVLSLRSNLEGIHVPSPSLDFSSQEGTLDRWDAQLLYHAKLLRRVRFDRGAIRVAEAGLKIPEEAKELTLGPRKLAWLKQYVREYQATEPELVAALSQTALARAYLQEYSNLFEDVIKTFRGPLHDPRNQLLTFLYYTTFENDHAAQRRAQKALDEYLTQDLPANEALPEPLRRAIASQIHCLEAGAKIALLAMQDLEGEFEGFWETGERGGAKLEKEIRTHLKKAQEACPANRTASEIYSKWLEDQLEEKSLTSKESRLLEEELVEVMQNWSTGCPDDVEPRLWLVDHLLENEQMTEARPHIDFLAASRHHDPRVRATPWKWQLLEAMRLCRRKTWLSDVPAHLDQAEALWPAWLSRQWLPYLRAAWMLRSGETEAYEAERQKICEASGVVRDSLADACMMLGAAQRMRVPAEGLKPLRKPVEEALKTSRNKIPLTDYLEAAGFFWDLHRIQMVYPSSRMHAVKIVHAIRTSWARAPRKSLQGIDEERTQKAALLCSEHRYWPLDHGYQIRPKSNSEEWMKRPIWVAAKANVFLKRGVYWEAESHRELVPILKEAAGAERDPYYRYWFQKLADELESVLAQSSLPFSGFPFNMDFDFGFEE